MTYQLSPELARAMRFILSHKPKVLVLCRNPYA
jgi:hypothetical protein